MHIVLDLQACQSPESSRRGIGRYSLALAKAMVTNPRGHDITVFLNATMSELIEPLRSHFDDLLPQDRIVIWQGLAPAASIDSTNAYRTRASELLRLEALKRLNPDVVHIASLFDGFGDNVVSSVPGDASYIQAVTLYDLIPLAHKKTYLSDSRVRPWYMDKVDNLRRANLLLGISQFSCREAESLLGFPPSRMVNISGAADDIFKPIKNAEDFRNDLMHRFGLDRAFVMYAGGFDSRKNIGALVRAFSLLPIALRRQHQLAIVGGAPAPERAALTKLAKEIGLGPDELVFTGYVPDGDLVKLYNLCALYVFPSLQEGFGLPALEAMSSGAIVIGSNTSSLPEVIGREDALFDPTSDDEIAMKMVRALADEVFRSNLRAHGRQQCQKFSWEESARLAIDAFEAVKAVRPPKSASKMRAPARSWDGVAYFPAPHSNVEFSDISAATIFADKDWVGVGKSHPLASFTGRKDRFNTMLIELADDPHCAKTLQLAASGVADILVQDKNFGRALYALAGRSEGRALIVAMLYRSGGYPAIRAALDADFSEAALGALVRPIGLTALGRSQVILNLDASSESEVTGLAWRSNLHSTLKALTTLEEASIASEQDWRLTAVALSSNDRVVSNDAPQWLVDISNLFVNDAGTGIQRVVRHVLDELMACSPQGYRVEPVVLSGDGVLRYARSYCQRRYFKTESLPPDEPVEFGSSDVFLGLDLAAHLIPAHINIFRHMRNRGVLQYFVVYDMLPVLRPDCFDPPGLPLFRAWYESVAEVSDGILCISKAVADEFELWLHQARPERHRPLNIGWFHLGADLSVATSTQSKEPGDDSLAGLDNRPTFLMVGTIEPRKGYGQTLAGFEKLWSKGIEANLLVIGKPGWLVEDLLQRFRLHPERGKRLFWFEKAGDDLLLAAYARASALLMASEGEGFGLPLIEAADHGVPLIARDLAVFREIAGEHALYFSGYGPDVLADALQEWLVLDKQGRAPQSKGITWKTWAQATAQLVEAVRTGQWVHRWTATPMRRFGAFDYRFHTQVGRLVRGRMITTGSDGLLIYGPYIPLTAGRYQIRIHGEGAGSAWFDVCSSRGTIVYTRRDFSVGKIDVESILVEGTFDLVQDVSDLEIRVGVAADTEMHISRLEIEPLTLEQLIDSKVTA